MISNNHSRLILLIAIILTIINLAAVTTVMVNYRKYHNHDSERPFQMERGDDSMVNAPGPAYLIRELGFNDEQQQAFRESRRKFRDEAMPLFNEIRQLNADLIDEIVKDKPDTLKLDSLSKNIGRINARVKQLSIRHLLEVKSTATPEQKEKLVFFYRELLSHDSGPMGKGMQHRYRHGQKHSGNN